MRNLGIAPPPPAHTEPDFVSILHAGYPDVHLLVLPKLDNVDGTFGIDQRVVLDACCIIANNKAGFLSTSQDPNDSVPVDAETLYESEYYYFLTAHDPTYAIVTDFRHWSWNALPPHWNLHPKVHETRFRQRRDSEMSHTVKDSDEHCIVTQCPAGTSSYENAHLVPKEQALWLVANRMARYNHSVARHTPNDPANGVCLRIDFHRCVDRQAAVFVPSPGQGFVVYFLQEDPTYASPYHLRAITLSTRVAPEFLYARFGFNVIGNIPVGTRRNPLVNKVVVARADYAPDAEVTDFEALKEDWFRKNPQIRQTSQSGSHIESSPETVDD